MRFNVRRFAKWFVVGSAAAAAIVVGLMLLKVIVAITPTLVVIALVAVAAVSLGRAFEKNKEEIKSAVQSVVAALKPDPVVELKRVLDALLRLNLSLRTMSAVEASLIGSVEGIIDELKLVMPQMLNNYPGETLTYEVKRIALEHLPKTVGQYLDLSADSRRKQLSVLEKSLADMLAVCRQSREVVERNEVSEFKAMANFLNAKYAQGATT